MSNPSRRCHICCRAIEYVLASSLIWCVAPDRHGPFLALFSYYSVHRASLLAFLERFRLHEENAGITAVGRVFQLSECT